MMVEERQRVKNETMQVVVQSDDPMAESIVARIIADVLENAWLAGHKNEDAQMSVNHVQYYISYEPLA